MVFSLNEPVTFIKGMDYLKEYKSFVNSHYLSQGLRITIGVIMPAIVLSYFNNLPTGIVVSLGAMSVSVTDNPGPIHHRRNGMIACNLIIFFVALITGYVAALPVVLGAFLFLCCFLFSIIGIYGSRATSIGLSALLVMVLNIDRPMEGMAVLLNAIYIFAGGAWYIVLSLLLYSLRPYKLIQQALGECIQSTADYLRIKAAFYSKGADEDKNYQLLLIRQADLHQKQDLIRELLFKSRNLVKESTNTSRILVMMFLDIVDLFERVMTSHQDYKSLHRFFDESNILEEYRAILLMMADDLDETGIAVKSGRPAADKPAVTVRLAALRERFFSLRDTTRTAENVEGFISLRHILESMEDIADRLRTLRGYTRYDKQVAVDLKSLDLDQFISHQDIDLHLVKENLSFSSNIFRHSIRVSVATLIGYIISQFLPFGHSYWVLLTIVVILKPAYTLTKKRNYERLFGTIAGAVMGIAVLYFFQDKTVLLAFLIFFMVCTYSLIRIRYLLSVLFMTPYILLLFHLLNPAGFRTVLSDRLIDTGIGSAIAFLANLFILPAWEHEQIRDYMYDTLKNAIGYFKQVAAALQSSPVSVTQYKLSRKNTFVAQANLSDAFNRMLSEPKSKQKDIRSIHQFVVLNHMLVSHIATLSYYARPEISRDNREDVSPFIEAAVCGLDRALDRLTGKSQSDASSGKEGPRMLNEKINRLVEQRKTELNLGITETDTRRQLASLKPVTDQFNFIIKIATDLEKLNAGIARQVNDIRVEGN